MTLIYFILLAAISNFFLGSFIIRTNSNNRNNQRFGLMAIMVGIWGIANYLFQITSNIELLKLVYFIGPFAITCVYLWAYTFKTHSKKRIMRILIGSILVIDALIGLVIFPTNLIVDKVINPLNILPGSLYNLYSTYLGVLFLGCSVYLINIYKNLDRDTQRRFKSVLIGFFIFISILILVTIILPIFHIVKFSVLDSPSSLIFVLFTFFSIYKYKTFNTKLASTIFLTIALWGILFSRMLVDPINSSSFLLDLIVFILSVIFGYMLIKSVYVSIAQKEELEQLTSKLEVANEDLKKLDKMKTEFVSLASHELLTPITAILGYLSVILDEKIITVGSKQGQLYLSRVYLSAKRLSRLVIDLLNVSRIEEGRLSVESKLFDINTIIDSVINEIKFKADEKKMTIAWKPKHNYNVYADVDKVQEVLVNLIGNAIKYGGKGLITVSTETIDTEELRKIDDQNTQAAKKQGLSQEVKSLVPAGRKKLIGLRQLVISIQDNGIGIASDQIDKLFQKFYRIGDIKTQSVQGTGLGLYISHTLAELMHGRMWVTSPGPDKGSTFFVSLPLGKYESTIKEIENKLGTPVNAKPLAHSDKIL
jgi:signal transduction histidine kinase